MNWGSLVAMIVISIEQEMVVVNHLNEGLVEGADVEDLFGLLDSWAENCRANGNCHVIRGHLVVRLIRDELLEELNEELEGIVIESAINLHRTELRFDEI